jgi:hypothetical protein
VGGGGSTNLTRYVMQMDFGLGVQGQLEGIARRIRYLGRGGTGELP